MSRNHKFFFDQDGSPKARGPVSEKMFMSFLETDVQGSDHICHDLMDDLTAIEDESDDSREFIGNAHCVTITANGVLITTNLPDSGDEPAEEAASTRSTSSAVDSATPTHEKTAETPGENPGDVSADAPATAQGYLVPLKHFREILEDWEAFILDDQLDDPMSDDEYV